MSKQVELFIAAKWFHLSEHPRLLRELPSEFRLERAVQRGVQNTPLRLHRREPHRQILKTHNVQGRDCHQM